MSDRRDILISKSLSYLLRHGALKERLPIDSNGYVRVNELLKHNRLKSHQCSIEDVHRIVRDNEKKRFHLKTEVLDTGVIEELICATQGHSIESITPDQEVLEQLKSLEQLPYQLVHGTSIPKALLIVKSGFIKKQGRNHVHLAPGVTGVDSVVISGMRYSSNVHIYIKVSQELIDNLRLYRSLNNVYLTPDDVPLSLFEKVTIRVSKKISDTSKELAAIVEILTEHKIPYQLLKSN